MRSLLTLRSRQRNELEVLCAEISNGNEQRKRATELHKCAAVESPLGAQTVLGDRTRSDLRSLTASDVGRLRNSPERTFQRLDAQTDSSTESAAELHKWSAVKSPLGAQTVLGDRHDPIYEV